MTIDDNTQRHHRRQEYKLRQLFNALLSQLWGLKRKRDAGFGATAGADSWNEFAEAVAGEQAAGWGGGRQEGAAGGVVSTILSEKEPETREFRVRQEGRGRRGGKRGLQEWAAGGAAGGGPLSR